ncbi:hypothetical protein [Nocardiopsis sp. NPDC006832]|uniref:hypothetical protein n=1 Tax=Nocardiopsis sp. NPDC006832 TaxID=3157188 RepID=UPI0033F4C5C2
MGRFDAEARTHPWTARATRYCLDAIARIEEAPFAYVLLFALGFLDAAADTHPQAREQRARLARFVPADGALPVEGGTEGETLHLLDLAPLPEHPMRDVVDAAAVTRDLDRLERGRRPDGGWAVDFSSHSEAAALEWRGYTTVSAVAVLRANGR